MRRRGRRPRHRHRKRNRNRVDGLAIGAPTPTLDIMTDQDNALTVASSRLLAPAGLDDRNLDRMFSALLGPGIDFGDLYFQQARRESWTVEDGIVKDGAHSIEQGVGV